MNEGFAEPKSVMRWLWSSHCARGNGNYYKRRRFIILMFWLMLRALYLQSYLRFPFWVVLFFLGMTSKQSIRQKHPLQIQHSPKSPKSILIIKINSHLFIQQYLTYPSEAEIDTPDETNILINAHHLLVVGPVQRCITSHMVGMSENFYVVGV